MTTPEEEIPLGPPPDPLEMMDQRLSEVERKVDFIYGYVAQQATANLLPTIQSEVMKRLLGQVPPARKE